MKEEQNIKQLPKDWKWVKLGDVCDKISVNNIKIKQKDYLESGLYPVVDQGKDLIGGYNNDKSLVVPYEPPYVVFGDHTKVKKFINFNFVPGADGVKVLKAKKSIDTKFLYYSLFTIKIEDKGYARHFQLLEKELFPLPPLPTQQAIVSKIEEIFSELDKGIENLRTAKQQLKTYRQAVLKHAFEGKLTEAWRRENVSRVVVPAAPLEMAMAAEEQAEYGGSELPKGWKWVSIGDIFEVFIGSTPKRNFANYWGGNINWVSSGEIAFCNITSTKETITEEGLESTSCKVHPPGTVIIAMIGEGKTRGQAAILKIDASHNQNTAAIRVNNNEYLSQLLYYNLLFKYEDNRKVGSGNNQKALNKERVKSIRIPFMSILEQNEIVQEIESRLSVADKMEESISQSLQQAEALRQSILKQAFEGRVI
jgi:type I restriction enzyme S subunit